MKRLVGRPTATYRVFGIDAARNASAGSTAALVARATMRAPRPWS
ncbi:hypothetical protein [Streptomyces lunaelactis]|nr:hypothetical protein [Streptomyces lunaelactis]